MALALIVGGGFATGWMATVLPGTAIVILLLGGRIISQRVRHEGSKQSES